MTFSIVARDPGSGQVGIAAQSRAFGVGRILRHVQPGVGAVATQAMAEPAHGTRTLAGMREGLPPADALAASLAQDEGRERRQVVAIDVAGRTATHTGNECIASAGHHADDTFVVAGNILANDRVVPAMVAAARAQHPSLARRLLAALVAGQEAGGDLRGRQSASMVIVAPEDTRQPLVDVLVDIRVDDHVDPIDELGRLLGIAEAHHDLELAEWLAVDGDVGGSADKYIRALERLGDDPEFHVWAAMSLASAGRADRARELVARLHGRPDADRWREFTSRLADAGLVEVNTASTWW